MKRLFPVLLLCILSILVAACTVSAAEAPDAAASREPPAVDLDLSLLSGTVVYAQVYNMMYDPDAYLGKIIRMAGYYNYFDDTGPWYGNG